MPGQAGGGPQRARAGAYGGHRSPLPIRVEMQARRTLRNAFCTPLCPSASLRVLILT